MSPGVVTTAASAAAASTPEVMASLRSLAEDLGGAPAPCHDVDPDVFFDAAISAAAALCAGCPARTECLAYADALDARHGVWGGRVRRLTGGSVARD